ncbi:MAG: phosphoribosylaminoimidazolesuccinocarboxamide synthase [Spiribacter sp.]|nr:phosphoribosylaminoimidazolesuccinocarboxamide synthase [Spiribacter sp.]MDR9488871.1 phosphoribosylaminoimidazolesuccinocarboxamide synthase [Spiribacter sp.]
MTPERLYQSEISSLPLIQRGKVRDVYGVDEEMLLVVTTDRLSAFDVVFDDPIPGKGAVLTQVSNFWFDRLGTGVTNQCLNLPVEAVLDDREEREQVSGRAVLVKRVKPLNFEAIARGYLIGSGWKDYQRSGQLCGIELPSGLMQAEQLPAPLFTPSTKANAGGHDENIDYTAVVAELGANLAGELRELTLSLYTQAAAYARQQGIIIADTKFEFGLDTAGNLVWIDEALTPDSSRFWPAEHYQPGSSPPSFDKQFVRDYLETLDWDKVAPAPRLPEEIIQQTAAKYREAGERLGVNR